MKKYRIIKKSYKNKYTRKIDYRYYVEAYRKTIFGWKWVKCQSQRCTEGFCYWEDIYFDEFPMAKEYVDDLFNEVPDNEIPEDKVVFEI